jgi:hypothetical protein
MAYLAFVRVPIIGLPFEIVENSMRNQILSEGKILHASPFACEQNNGAG